MSEEIPCELLDVVDEQDRVVRRAERREVHRLGLMHRAVHVFLVDGQDRLYLQRRSWSKDQLPGVWDSSASGHVDSGESYAEAARRELEEELGIAVPLEALFKAQASEETGGEHSLLYLARVRAGGAEPQPNPAEILEGGFFGVAEIEQWLDQSPQDFSPAFRLLFGRWHAGDGWYAMGEE